MNPQVNPHSELKPSAGADRVEAWVWDFGFWIVFCSREHGYGDDNRRLRDRLSSHYGTFRDYIKGT